MNKLLDDMIAVAMQFGLNRQLAVDFADAVLDRLTKNIGGDRLYIYKKGNMDRDNGIRDLYEKGVPVRTLALRYKLTARTIRRILSVENMQADGKK